jgi:nitrite reductase/ring-hydroxylating ferredoxin subunit
VASVYEREIGASLERVWENVYDWAHLPFLHSEAFSAIERLASGEWGWHARIGIGEGFVSLYTLLWDQDEDMMQTREAALAKDHSVGRRAGDSSVSLGALDSLRGKLPLTVDFDGQTYRVVELDGELIVHGTECPHLLGPLDETEIVDGKIVCPWHGYAFDVRRGRSCDGRGLSLAKAPAVEIDPASGNVELRKSSGGPRE